MQPPPATPEYYEALTSVWAMFTLVFTQRKRREIDAIFNVRESWPRPMPYLADSLIRPLRGESSLTTTTSSVSRCTTSLSPEGRICLGGPGR